MFRHLDRSIDKACQAQWATERRRLLLQADLLAGEINDLPPDSAVRQAKVAVFVEINARLDELHALLV